MSSSQMYVRVRGKVLGPFSSSQLKALKDRGQFHGFHEVSEDRANWRPASTLPGMFGPEPSVQQPVTAKATAVAESPAHPTVPDEEWFYVNQENKEVGPISRDQLLRLSNDGSVQQETQVWRRGTRDWTTFAEAGLNRKATRFESVVSTQSDQVSPLRLFLVNPISGLPQMISRLSSLAAGNYGLLFYVFFLLMCLVSVMLGSLVHKLQIFRILQDLANNPNRMEIVLKFFLLIVLPLLCFWSSISILRLVTRSHGHFGADGLIAGSVFLVTGLFLPLVVVFVGVSNEALMFLIYLMLTFQVLQLYAAFSQTLKLPDFGVVFAIPAVFFINWWLMKMAVKLLFRVDWPGWNEW